MTNIPLVSICCVTYNHNPFIKEAIEGFLMQKTDFQFEIIIHDDASADGTTEIIKGFESLYPELIFPIYQTENQYSKNPGTIEARFVWQKVRGKYIALCEGDDYWTDKYKLQKQVDFLEKNDEFGLVHGNCNFYFEEKMRWEFNANKNLTNKTIFTSNDEIFYELVNASYKIRTATVLFRKALLEKIKPNDNQFIMFDTPLWLDLSQNTKFKYFDQIFSVYRILGESASRSDNLIKKYRFKLSMIEMRIYYLIKYGYPIRRDIATRYNEALLTYKLFDKNFAELYPLFKLSLFQKMKYKAIKYDFLRQLFLLKYKIMRSIYFVKKRLI